MQNSQLGSTGLSGGLYVSVHDRERTARQLGSTYCQKSNFPEATTEIRKLLSTLSFHRCFDRRTWPSFRFFALVRHGEHHAQDHGTFASWLWLTYRQVCMLTILTVNRNIGTPLFARCSLEFRNLSLVHIWIVGESPVRFVFELSPG